MEKFLEAAAIAWNPIGEIRRRMQAGTLKVGAVLAPFIAIVVTCNLFVIGAEKFFWESLLYASGGTLPDIPLMKSPLLTSEYAQRFMSAIGVLAPALGVSLLPSTAFDPPGRSATIATMFVIAAAWAFYGAAIGVPVYFVAGALATVDFQFGLRAFMLLSLPMAIGILGLTVYFWFKATLSVLSLRGTQVTLITMASLIAASLVIGGFFLVVGMASASGAQ